MKIRVHARRRDKFKENRKSFESFWHHFLTYKKRNCINAIPLIVMYYSSTASTVSSTTSSTSSTGASSTAGASKLL